MNAEVFAFSCTCDLERRSRSFELVSKYAVYCNTQFAGNLSVKVKMRANVFCCCLLLFLFLVLFYLLFVFVVVFTRSHM